METVSYTKLLLDDFSLHYWPLTPSVTRTLEKGWKHLYLLLTLDFIWSHLIITPLNVAFWRAVWTHSNLYLDVTFCKGDLVLANTIAISTTSLLHFYPTLSNILPGLPLFMPKANNQPLKKFLSLAVSWVKVVKNGKILTFKVNFLCQKLSKSV